MQLFHVMTLRTAPVQNIWQYTVEDIAVPRQHLVTPFIMEQNATHVVVCKSCEIQCILLPCLWSNTCFPVQLYYHNSSPQHDLCTCVFCTQLVNVFHSLVHGFECLHYEVSRGFDLRAPFRHNVKGTTAMLPRLDGKINLTPITESQCVLNTAVRGYMQPPNFQLHMHVFIVGGSTVQVRVPVCCM